MIIRKYKLEKLLYNDLNFINDVNKIVGDISFHLVNYIMDNRFYNDSDFTNYFLLNYLFDFSKSCDRFVDIFYIHINITLYTVFYTHFLIHDALITVVFLIAPFSKFIHPVFRLISLIKYRSDSYRL